MNREPVPGEVICSWLDASRRTGRTSRLLHAQHILTVLFSLTPAMQEDFFKLMGG